MNSRFPKSWLNVTNFPATLILHRCVKFAVSLSGRQLVADGRHKKLSNAPTKGREKEDC